MTPPPSHDGDAPFGRRGHRIAGSLPAIVGALSAAALVSPGCKGAEPLVDPEIVAACEAAADVCPECFEVHEEPALAEATRALLAARRSARELRAELGDACSEMASVLELDVEPDAGLDRCRQVARHIEQVSAAYLSPSEALVLSEAPSRCELALEDARACATACGLEPGSITCDGASVGRCEGRCRGTCEGDCGAGCAGGCAGFCTGTCDGACAGQCDGICAVVDSLGGCLGACDGRCEGVCSGTCDGTCDEIESRQAVCVGGCDGACDGTCIGTCDTDWAPRCAGPLSIPEADPCGLACVLSAGLDATCTTPNVRIRGPELADADAHVVMDRAVVALLVHGGALRRIEADTELRLRALPRLAEAVRTAAAESRVVDCGPPVHAALAEALSAYEGVRTELAELFAAPRAAE